MPNQYLILLLFLLCACGAGKNYSDVETVGDQSIVHRVVHPELIRKFEIKYLEIENCLFESSCFRTKYTFNNCGEIEDYYPPMVSTWWNYEYDENCKLISAMSQDFTCYKYTYLENDFVLQEVYNVVQDSVMDMTDRFKFKEIKKRGAFEPFILSLEPQQDTINNLSFPCGIEYPGQNILVYNYYDNGLTKSVQFYDVNNKLIVQEDYKYYNEEMKPVQ
jgi:hypothetical protein